MVPLTSIPWSRGTAVRRVLAIVGITVLGAALWGGMSVAGAQTTTTTAAAGVFTCEFSLTSTSLPVGGGTVQISGTAPADTTVHILVNSVEVATAHSDIVTGAWGPLPITITATSTVEVSINLDYPATPCIGPAAVTVEAAAAALPRTGSNDTKPFVLIGAALLVVGAALVLGARRRGNTRGRA